MGFNLDAFAGGLAQGFAAGYKPELIEKARQFKAQQEQQEIEENRRIAEATAKAQEKYQELAQRDKENIARYEQMAGSARSISEYNGAMKGISTISGQQYDPLINISIEGTDGIIRNVTMPQSLSAMDNIYVDQNGQFVERHSTFEGDEEKQVYIPTNFRDASSKFQGKKKETVSIYTPQGREVRVPQDKADELINTRGFMSSKPADRGSKQSYDKFYNQKAGQWVSIPQGKEIPAGFLSAEQLKESATKRKQGVLSNIHEKVLAEKTSELVGADVKDEVVEELTTGGLSKDNIIFDTQMNDKQKQVFLTGVNKYVNRPNLTNEDLNIFYRMSDAEKVDFIFREEGYAIEQESSLYQLLPNIFGISDVKIKKIPTKGK